MKRYRILSLALFVTLPGTPLSAQQPSGAPALSQQSRQDEETLKITTNVVQVDVVVTDKDGQPRTDLRLEDFEISEDGKRQTITNCSYIPLVKNAGDSQNARDVISTPGANSSPLAGSDHTGLQPENVRRTVALVVDDLGLSFESVGFVKQALKQFIDAQMQPTDLIAVVTTSGGAGVKQQLTADKRQLNAAIDRIRWNPAGRGGLSAYSPTTDQRESMSANEGSADNPMMRIRQSAEHMELMEQAREGIYQVGTMRTLNEVVKGLGGISGRKSIVFISEAFRLFSKQGRNFGLLHTIDNLAAEANRTSTAVYTLDASGLNDLGPKSDDKITGPGYTFDKSVLGIQGSAGGVRQAAPRDMGQQAQVDSIAAFRKLDALANQRVQSANESQTVLSYLANQTGGLFVGNRNNLGKGVQRLMDDQQGYYLLGYRPADSPLDPTTGRLRAHNLTVKVKQSGLKVRARSSFYAPAPVKGNKVPATREERLSAALTSPFTSSDIAVRMTPIFSNEMDTGPVVRLMIHINARDLSFADGPTAEKRAAIEVVAVNFDSTGAVVGQQSYPQEIRAGGDEFRALQENGLVYALPVQVKGGGAYSMRIAVRDAASERIGTASQFVEVPEIAKNRLALSGISLSGTSQNSQLQSVNSSAAAVIPEADFQAGPAIRRLRNGMLLEYNYSIYNAQFNNSARPPQLQAQMQLLRDGKVVFSGKVVDIDATKQSDLKRIATRGRLRIGPDLVPGSYVLRVMVRDVSAKDGSRTASQWTDFEVVG